jgi:hypothetical protein
MTLDWLAGLYCNATKCGDEDVLEAFREICVCWRCDPHELPALVERFTAGGLDPLRVVVWMHATAVVLARVPGAPQELIRLAMQTLGVCVLQLEAPGPARGALD